MSKNSETKPLVIRPWPKMIFLWPTTLMSLFMGLAQWSAPAWGDVWGGLFLLVVGLNLMVITFEFPRATSLTVAVGVVSVILLLMVINHSFEIISPLKSFVANRQIMASTEFYLFFFTIQVFLFAGMVGVTRFDYWVLSPNELVHHHGMLGDIERFSTAGLKLNKEISDIFEYVLCGAGTIILLIPGMPRPIVLENVLFIKNIEKLSDRLLDARVVRVQGDEPNEHDITPIHQEAEGG